jgi:hypothetical protein
MWIPLLLLIALTNCAHLLSACLASENSVLYREGRAYKRAPELVASPQWTTLHSTGNTSVKNSVHKNEVGHSNTRGIVSLCYFSRWITAAHSPHFQHFMWTELSKEKPLLALFISTSNEHILDKRMVKTCGLTICLIRMSVQWLTCWHVHYFNIY